MTHPHRCPECRQPLWRRHARPRLIGGIAQERHRSVLFCRNSRCQLVVPDDFFLDTIDANTNEGSRPHGSANPNHRRATGAPLSPPNGSRPTQAGAIA